MKKTVTSFKIDPFFVIFLLCYESPLAAAAAARAKFLAKTGEGNFFAALKAIIKIKNLCTLIKKAYLDLEQL